LAGRQTIKVGYLHDRQIMPNNFVDKGKETNLSVKTSQNFSLVCMRVLPPQGQPLIICRLCQCGTINFILTN